MGTAQYTGLLQHPKIYSANHSLYNRKPRKHFLIPSPNQSRSLSGRQLVPRISKEPKKDNVRRELVQYVLEQVTCLLLFILCSPDLIRVQIATDQQGSNKFQNWFRYKKIGVCFIYSIFKIHEWHRCYSLVRKTT